MKASDKPPEQPFEAVLGDLENLVESLEKGDIPLEDSVRLYEQGVGLVRQANLRLARFEERIEKLNSSGELEPFVPDDDEDDDDGDSDP